jgi:D-alanyl-D-alanine dipeptidase
MTISFTYRSIQRLKILVVILGIYTNIDAQTADFKTIRTVEELDSAKRINTQVRLIEIKQHPGKIALDLRYATKNNFTKRRMYPASTQKTYLLNPAYEALQAAMVDFAKAGYYIKIFDAYRPYSVTVDFWELIHDERYVANPKNGSGHNKGISIDLTLINAKTGAELNMGTGFDNFSDTAHHSFQQLPIEIINNRKILKTTMEKQGFIALETEWWHYSLPNPKQYPVIDIPFKQLKKLNR